MDALARLPVFLALEHKRAVVAGGSAAAAWKAELLSATGACVDVYAEETSAELSAIAGDPPRGPITLHIRKWTAADLAGAALAIGAFDADADAAVFANAARAAGVAANVIDKPAFCDFSFGAIVNRSPLVIGISTDGAAPVFAQAIRAKLETVLPRGFAVWAAAAQSWRAAVKLAGLSNAARRKFWLHFAARAVIYAERQPAQADFERLLVEVQEQGATVEQGLVTFIHAPSADPDLLTLRAVRILQSADIILFDELVSREVLDFARREARKLLIGESTDADIDTLMAGLARHGRRVVRLSGRAAGSGQRESTTVSASAGANSSAAHNGAAA
jgi:uroporphyrin-III C-methyltransferase/precorrin-2 dehydrogenase/sirohydrochlorin ferrochelatase